MDAQLKRGLLDLCVLAAMRGGDAYGYQLIRDISPHIEISESTLYPILKRLESAGCVSSYSIEHNGRLRRYYRLEAPGRDRLREFCEESEQLVDILDWIRKENPDETK
ncbi:MAG: PadR family transcriptional regulator [Clostridia bacterium]|nr:PadR family transcriptional regulator [Clostridia bacterium]